MSTRVIWKYRLADGQGIVVPPGAIVRHLGWQDGEPTLWLECGAGYTERVLWLIDIVGTGQAFPYRSEAEFLGTLIDGLGMFVWHVFARRGDKWSADQQARYEQGERP